VKISEIEQMRREARQTLNHYRSMILDSAELECGTTPGWKFYRSRLLKILGPRGLEGRLLQILGEELDGDSDAY
jgi:hypothetical protein